MIGQHQQHGQRPQPPRTPPTGPRTQPAPGRVMKAAPERTLRPGLGMQLPGFKPPQQMPPRRKVGWQPTGPLPPTLPLWSPVDPSQVPAAILAQIQGGTTPGWTAPAIPPPPHIRATLYGPYVATIPVSSGGSGPQSPDVMTVRYAIVST